MTIHHRTITAGHQQSCAIRGGFLLLCLLISTVFDAVAQRDSLPSIDLGLGWGITHLTANDRLVNYFPYSGFSFSALQFCAVYHHRPGLFELCIDYHSARLLPRNTVAVNYEYNYMDQTGVGGAIGWFRKVGEWAKVARLYLGAEGGGHLDILSEEYRNWLYPVPGSRMSYDFSSIGLSPAFLLEWFKGRASLKLKASMIVFCLSARPEDDYIKRVQTKADFRWRLYSLASYRAAEIALRYHYRLAKGWGISLEYDYRYRSYLTSDDYQYAQHSLLLGFSKAFHL